MRRFLNGLLFGSPAGPAIRIDWDTQEIVLARMPLWLCKLVIHWLQIGKELDNATVEDGPEVGL